MPGDDEVQSQLMGTALFGVPLESVGIAYTVPMVS
jgi:hypothetical protein